MIKELIAKFLCLHVWKNTGRLRTFAPEDNPEKDLPIKSRTILICDKCGKITYLDL